MDVSNFCPAPCHGPIISPLGGPVDKLRDEIMCLDSGCCGGKLVVRFNTSEMDVGYMLILDLLVKIFL